MIVVAGPAGSGKSTVFPVASFGAGFFSVDDRCAELNGGSFTGITAEIRDPRRRGEPHLREHPAPGASPRSVTARERVGRRARAGDP